MKKSVVVLIHGLLWVLIFFTFFNILHAISGLYKKPDYNPYLNLALYIRTASSILMLAVPFYFGYFITPYLFRRQKRKLLISIAVLFGIFFPITISVLDDGFRPSAITQSIFACAFLNTFMILGIGIRSLFGWIEQKRLQEKLEKQNLHSELALLRTQLNPHFLFNSLHNIDTLIKKEPDKASEQLLKLSEIMRYMLYDSNIDKISLQKEIDHIENYISLQEIRLKDNTIVHYSKQGNFNSMTIAPMLLIPFVENTFKHFKQLGDGKIIINISVDENHLFFNCSNTYELNDANKDKTKGIGLETVKRRLELIYPNKHSLKINDRNNTFDIELIIATNHD